MKITRIDKYLKDKKHFNLGSEIGKKTSAFIAKLATESERAAVVLGTARLDYALEKLLKSILRSNPGGNDSLFSADQPLSSFAAKIALSYRLGLIDSDFEHALQMIRKIRNAFAHSIDTESLKDSRHRDRILESMKLAKNHPSWETLYDVLADIKPEELRNFCCVIAIIISTIELIELLNEQVTVNCSASFDTSIIENCLDNLEDG
ncbi:MAG: hypothetical protein HY755_12875 [Nitrospirae bacterium]|nr:hypothetical protein [Nitrospirota bacterium]